MTCASCRNLPQLYKKICGTDFYCYICNPNQGVVLWILAEILCKPSEMKLRFHFRGAAKISAIFRRKIAEIAQLVEHDLAKVGVASSSLVFRSKARQAAERLPVLLLGGRGSHERPQAPMGGRLRQQPGGHNRREFCPRESAGSSLVFRSFFVLFKK